jgi:hypothetical protein
MKHTIYLILIGVLLAGCSGGTSFSSACNNATDAHTSTCDIDFATLTGEYRKDVNVEHIVASGQPTIPLYLEMTVASGTVLVSYTDGSGQTATQTGSQSTPVVIQGTASVDVGNVVKLTFSSGSGTATGVSIDLAAGENAWPD